MVAIGDPWKVTGYITQDKYLRGRTLATLESYLGFHTGRLAHGATFVRLDRLPQSHEFELAGYSMTAAHRHQTPAGLNISKLKELVHARWSLTGGDRLIKVCPATPHQRAMSDDDQYPPGAGVPQWRIVSGVQIAGTVVAQAFAAADKYLPKL